MEKKEEKSLREKTMRISRYSALIRDIADFIDRLPEEGEETPALNKIANELTELLKKVL